MRMRTMDTIEVDPQKLIRCRKAANHEHQGTAALAAGISRTYLNELESGKKQPSKPVIAALAMAYQVDPSDFGVNAAYREGTWKT